MSAIYKGGHSLRGEGCVVIVASFTSGKIGNKVPKAAANHVFFTSTILYKVYIFNVLTVQICNTMTADKYLPKAKKRKLLYWHNGLNKNRVGR